MKAKNLLNQFRSWAEINRFLPSFVLRISVEIGLSFRLFHTVACGTKITTAREGMHEVGLAVSANQIESSNFKSAIETNVQ